MAGIAPALAADRRRFAAAARTAGVDHLAVGDHVSFFVGAGRDGLVEAASLLAVQDELPVYVGAYLLPLRHPVIVARQLATIAELAPGRLTLGVGIGGEDRHEVEICGVDPRTRGRRMDECLTLLRALLRGEPATLTGEFLDVRDALILPAPDPPVRITVGGRSAAAVRRAALLGDGWLAIWVSPRRCAAAYAEIAERAAAAGRDPAGFEHALNVWCGLGAERGGRPRAAGALDGGVLRDAVRRVRALLALRPARGRRRLPRALRRGGLCGVQPHPLRRGPGRGARGRRRGGAAAARPQVFGALRVTWVISTRPSSGGSLVIHTR